MANVVTNAGCTKTFELYFDDLTKAAQDKLVEFLGGDNGNYDVIPLVRLEIPMSNRED